jgi:hypothetical protein
LVAFIRIPTLAAALVAMLWMCAMLTEATFSPYYVGHRLFNTVTICMNYSALPPLIVLATIAVHFKNVLWSVATVFGVSVAVYAGIMIAMPHAAPTPQNQGMLRKCIEITAP